MAEHTPGTWEVQRTARLGLPGWRVQHNHYDHRGSVVVATVDSEANARFIAAAPDMEKALEMYIQAEDSEPSSVEQFAWAGDAARAALAKARGETDV